MGSCRSGKSSKPKQSGIYCRLSYAPDGSIEKVERQESDCRELAARLGWTISEGHVFRDNSRSAWQRHRKRPAWDKMLEAIEAGEIDSIIVYHGDRLIRQPYDLEKLIGIADSKGIRIASPSGTRDLDSPDDRFILRIEAAQACRESDNTSRRVQRAVAARAAAGRTAGGGRRPFGFGVQTGTRTKTDPKTGETVEVPVYDITQQVPKEAKLLREAAKRLLAGQEQGGVVRWLNTKSTTTEGNRWHPRVLKNLMVSPRIAGLVEHQGHLYDAVWDGIISRETWEDLKALYARSAEENPFQGRERVHLLTGVAECVTCGTTVRCKPTGGRNRKTSRLYYCPNPECKDRVGRNQENLDRYVEGRVLLLLADRRFVKEVLASDDKADINAEIVALETRREEAEEQLKNIADYPNVNAGVAAMALASFDRKIDELRNRLATTARRRLLLRMAGISREKWNDEPIDVRTATVQAIFRVIILPATWRGPGFDPASVDLRRRPLSAGD